jgi:wyosine [tRNA(Phe)-imidazoG37] synthetase (radical SAM superfamily)
VPGLSRGAAPAIDLRQLEDELRRLLDAVTKGDFYDRYQLAPEQRAIRDIAISGNGESTTCAQFGDAIGVIGQVAAEYDLLGRIKLVLITNGSQMQKPAVQQGISHWCELGGVVWFKLDSATEAGILHINNVSLSPATVRKNLEICARLCPTLIQTCRFALDGLPPDEVEQAAYLAWLAAMQRDGVAVEGVLLYGLARPSR